MGRLVWFTDLLLFSVDSVVIWRSKASWAKVENEYNLRSATVITKNLHPEDLNSSHWSDGGWSSSLAFEFPCSGRRVLCCWLVGSKPSLFSPVFPYSSALWRSSPCDFVLLSVPRAALRLYSFSLLCERNMVHRPGLSDRSGFCGGGAGGAGGAKLRIWICWIYGSPLHLLSSGLTVFHLCHGRSRIWPIGWRFSSLFSLSLSFW